MTTVYCISAKDTVFQHPDVLKRYGIDEVLCLRVVGGLYYCPTLKAVFARSESDDSVHYSWDSATFPSYDDNWDALQLNPMWRMGICHIDAPKQKPFSDDDL